MAEQVPKSAMRSIGCIALVALLLVSGVIAAVSWNRRRLEDLHPSGYRLLLTYRDLRVENLGRWIESQDWDLLAEETASRRLGDAASWREFLASQPQQDCLLGLWDFQDRPILTGRFFLSSHAGTATVAWEEISLPNFQRTTGVDLMALWDSCPDRHTTTSMSYGGPAEGAGRRPLVDVAVHPGLTTFDKFDRFGWAGDELNFGQAYMSGWNSFHSDKLIAVNFEVDKKLLGPWQVIEIGFADEVRRTARVVQYLTTEALLRWIGDRYEETDLDERLSPDR